MGFCSLAVTQGVFKTETCRSLLTYPCKHCCHKPIIVERRYHVISQQRLEESKTLTAGLSIAVCKPLCCCKSTFPVRSAFCSSDLPLRTHIPAATTGMLPVLQFRNDKWLIYASTLQPHSHHPIRQGSPQKWTPL